MNVMSVLPDAAATTDWLLRTMLQTAVLVALVLAVLAVAGRWMSPGCRYALWGLVALRLATPVLPASPSSLFNLLDHDQDPPASTADAGAAIDTGWIVTRQSLSPPPVPAGIASPPASAHDPTWSWQHTLLAAWLGVALLLLGRLILVNLLFARRLRRLDDVHDAAAVAMLDRCRRLFTVRQQVRLVETDAVAGPALTGVLRPTLLMPTGMIRRLSPSDLRFIFLHELAHLKRHDILVDWCLSLLQCVHWLNPAAWLAVTRLRAERELARDAMVLHLTAPAEAAGYGNTILKLTDAVGRHPRYALRLPAVGIVEEKRQLKRRIAMIAHFDPRSRSRGLVLASALGLALICVAFTDKTPPNVVANAPDEPTSLPPAPAANPDDTRVRTSVVQDPEQRQQRGRQQEHADQQKLARQNDVDARLKRRLPEVRFEQVTLTDAIDFLRDITGANIFVNWVALEQAKIERNAPVTLRVRDVEFEKALTMMLENVGGGAVKLDFMTDEGVIIISTAAHIAAANNRIAVYDVRDLLPDADADPKTREAVANDVLKLITETVDPKSWVEGSTRYLAGQLILMNTPKNHQKVIQLLNQLRESRSLQVHLDIRVIKTDPQVIAKHNLTPPDPKSAVILDPPQVTALLKSIQADAASSIVSSPRILLVNGQRGTATIGHEIPYITGYRQVNGQFQPDVSKYLTEGFTIDVTPTVSRDRKSVVISVHPRITKFERMIEAPWDKSPPGKDLKVQIPQLAVQEFNSVVTIANGQTAAALLTPQDGERRGGDREPVHLVLVKADVVVQREVDQKPFPLIQEREANQP